MSVDPTDELRDRAEEYARQFLTAAGFDFTSPSPRVAWDAFKVFAAADMPEPSTVTIGYEAYQAADRDRELWLSFVRSVESGGGLGWHVGYVLSCTAPASLVGVHDANWWWGERLSLEAWFAEVESNRVFQECLALPAWTWEGFSD